jgi:2-iminobutanoate/2-iminopropanoate deaminase
MNKRIVMTKSAPLPIGPYSQAIAGDRFLFISGQIPLDPTSGSLVGTTIEEQATQALWNLCAILVSEGLSADAVIKTTVFLTDMAHFAAFNKIYESVFGAGRPARSVVAVAGLPKNALVEIEAIACR